MRGSAEARDRVSPLPTYPPVRRHSAQIGVQPHENGDVGALSAPPGTGAQASGHGMAMYGRTGSGLPRGPAELATISSGSDAFTGETAGSQGGSAQGSAAEDIVWSFETPESVRVRRASKGTDSFSAYVASVSPSTHSPQESAWSAAVLDFNAMDGSFELPITASRSARWYASAFHCITAMVGAGVLALPSAMAHLGWGLGAFLLALCWGVTLYSLWQLAYLHEFDGKRFNRYHELGQRAFGNIAGLWIVVPFQLTVMIGLGIVYALTSGQLLHHVWQLTCKQPCVPFGLSAWIIVFCAFQLLLSQLPNFNALRWVSFLSALMSISYSTMAMVASLVHGRVDGVSYSVAVPDTSRRNELFNAFAALGTLSFAYGGHNVVLEIQATMPSPPPTFAPMMKGVYLAYGLVAYCYFGVAFAGYWAFGQSVEPNILFSLDKPTWLIVMVDITVVIHMCGSFQIYSMPVFDMIETLMVRKGVSNTTLPRLLYRTAYVVVLGFIGIAVPFFGDLMAVIGALAYGPTTFLLPSIMYLMLVKPDYRNIHFSLSWINIVVGFVVTLLGTVGGIRNLSVRVTQYENYFA